MHVLLIFIDGFGLGSAEPEKNPLVTASTLNWRRLLGGRPLTKEAAPFLSSKVSLVPTDATLGVPGIPQSATGQTALLTGRNAAKAMGSHQSGYPTQALCEMIADYSILKQVLGIGLNATFANMFRDEYFQMAGKGKLRNSVTTEATLAANLPLRRKEDLLAGRAVFQDITNEHFLGKGYDIPLFSPEKAGIILAQLCQEYHFTLFEYFQTDRAGHKQNWERSLILLENLDRFYGTVLAEVDLDRTLVILASDHGNIEDLSVCTHTTNPVPVLLAGKKQAEFADKIRDLTDITPAILGLLSETNLGC